MNDPLERLANREFSPGIREACIAALGAGQYAA